MNEGLWTEVRIMEGKLNKIGIEIEKLAFVLRSWGHVEIEN